MWRKVMEIQNTKDFRDFILEQEITDEKANNIENIIGAFSEYIVAVNPDYVYNKTYLSAFVEEFILCQKALKRKYQILLDYILTKFMLEGIERECVIRIDGAWKYENGNIRLNNFLNPNCIKRDKIQLEMEFIHDNGFVIAEEINIKEDYDKILDECISTFLNRRKELLGDEA